MKYQVHESVTCLRVSVSRISETEFTLYHNSSEADPGGGRGAVKWVATLFEPGFVYNTIEDGVPSKTPIPPLKGMEIILRGSPLICNANHNTIESQISFNTQVISQ